MKHKLFLVLVIVCSLSGCVQAKLDPLLLGESNCSPPCWLGIRPGETRKVEALKAIESLDNDVRFSVEEPFIYFSYGDKISNRLHLNSAQIVDWIELELKPTGLSQLIDTFGEPDHLLFMVDPGGCILNIFYPHNGLYFQGHCKSSIGGEYWIVSPNTKLYSTYFIEKPMQIEEMLLLFYDEDLVIRIKDKLQSWTGYGKYPIDP